MGVARSCQGPCGSVVDLNGTARADLDDLLVEIRNRICRISPLSYPYEAITLYLSNFALSPRCPSVPHGLR